MNSASLSKSTQAGTENVVNNYEENGMVVLWFLLSHQQFALSVQTSTEMERGRCSTEVTSLSLIFVCYYFRLCRPYDLHCCYPTLTLVP